MSDILHGRHEGDCLMCAVRALTEGRPPEWANPQDRVAGDTVTGVMMRKGATPTAFSSEPVTYIDLWTGGANRVRVTAFGEALRYAIDRAEIQVGDTVTVRFDGVLPLNKPQRGIATYRAYTVTVERGHH